MDDKQAYFQSLARAYPTAHDLRERARRLMPNFAFSYMDGGAGTDQGIDRNWAALDAVELAPRYGKVARPPACGATLFGRSYAAPIGVSPIGGPGTAFPGAETYLAAAAQAANVPYTLGLLSGIDVERAATIAPDVLWFQLYRFARNDHVIGLDLTRRAAAAGVKVLVLTIDTPTRTTRPRETKSGILHPFRVTNRLRLDALTSPRWMASMAKNGSPRFASLKPYMKDNPSLEEAAAFIRQESGGAFTWEEIARYRDVWKGPLVIKGILHPADARRVVELGAEGMFVSNHGGRQVECLPPAIDVLPSIAAEVAGRATIIFDSGVRSGVDAARAIALGADAAFSGKAFLWSLGALGADGPAHFINLLSDDLRATMGQLGCATLGELRGVDRRHRNAWRADGFNA
ncbi:MAG: alpha-hydroxy-acid oxidizing protein [Beijerinckiaceae bacterium]|jgi:(S)-mandelate dehydrogenase|nr:alpha-hydroxy-acid oxidizing protein [Beijerinckiaceae bacterium]